MTLQQALYALTIEECGSMSKASEKLYIVQPTLTSAIQELENEMGITIFLRTHKGVIPTPEGMEFLNDIRNLYRHYTMLVQKYEGEGNYRRKFGVSTQHYSFAVKAFVEMAKRYDMKQFDFAIRETQTKTVLTDVGSLKSEIGVLYVSARNEKMLRKLMTEQGVIFHPLIKCRAYVYLWDQHPLAKEKSISMEQLEPYPCLSFEQEGDEVYLAEEILSEKVYSQTVQVNDRSTMLNLMVGLHGYTLCSGIISGDLNGDGYVVVPFHEDEENPNSIMEIGYITKKNSILSKMGEEYIEELKNYLKGVQGEAG
ncbi:MAG: LysR family transcriptional regulator [Lachnospiraceae bacterium]|nr:LysR family transcriptional regulator [Lachnospiraceae bacterium]